MLNARGICERSSPKPSPICHMAISYNCHQHISSTNFCKKPSPTFVANIDVNILVTILYLWPYDGDNVKMLVTFLLKLRLFNLKNRLPTPSSCNLHTSSPISVTNIDVPERPFLIGLNHYSV